MVNITLTKQETKFKALRVTGHANAGDYNHDLVCAAITGIVSGALNAFDLDYQTDVELKVLDNDIQIVVKNLANQEVQTNFAFLINQLKTITVQYPKNAILKEVN